MPRVGTQPLWDAKVSVREAVKAAKLDWTFVNTSGITEFMFSPFLGFNVAEKTAEVIGDGNWRVSVISLGDLARILPAVLLHPASRNTDVNLSSDQVSWNEGITAFETAAGAKFTRTVVSLDEIRQWRDEAAVVLKKDPSTLMVWYVHNLKHIFATDPTLHVFAEPFNAKYPEVNGTQGLTKVADYAKQVFANK